MTWQECRSPVPNCKAFSRDVDDGQLCVFVGKEMTEDGPQWHLSISHRSVKLVTAQGFPLPGRYPTWDEIKEARYRFVPDEVNMAMQLPPKRLYVAAHPTCFHLWEIDMKYAGGEGKI